ncbi:MAG TPA: phosphotransferase [Solirubrobacteraceae bacterium]|nr:phosphotransferase [Solirubrobacteraceae bacterium]
MAEWDAEVEVDESLARRLIGGQFPEVGPALRRLGSGWDNDVWLADERWTFRFPRRALAIEGVEREIAALPRLAPHLPLPVPVPELVGRPADGYPWPFFGARFIPGREIAEAELDDDARDRLARPLAGFLRALHDSRLGGLPDDPFRRGDMAFRAPATRERLAAAEQLGLWRAPPAVAGLLARAERLPPPRAAAVVHGDLHFRHLLVRDGALAGVIDWGDLCRADPSIDLVLVWTTLDRHGREAFLAEYGPVEEEALLRARVLALFLSATLAVFARREGLGALEREAVASLARASRD